MTIPTFPAVVPLGVAGAALTTEAGKTSNYRNAEDGPAAIDVDSTSLPNLAALSEEDVRNGVVLWAGRVAAGEARLLAYVGELDAREAWTDWGLLSCAHWLSWKCGMNMRTAREYVRVARALRELPLTCSEFHAGRLSYSQVRAITRAATNDDERQWVDLARCATGSQLDKLVRGVLRARRTAMDRADPEGEAYRLRTTVRYEDDGTMLIVSRWRADDGAVVLAALEAARADLDVQRQAATDCGETGSAEPRNAQAEPAAPVDGHEVSPEGAAGLNDCGEVGSAEPRHAQDARPPRATLGDAFLHVAREFLDRRGQERPDAARRSRSKLQVLVDPLSGWARLPDGELLPAPVTAPLLRDVHGWGLRPLTALELTARDLGRAAREPDLALRELLGQIDGERCRFPGCARARKLHAHHVIFWSNGGRTDLSNLILLCGRHHTLVHRDGYRLTLHPDRTLDVSTTDGEQIPHRPALPRQPARDLDTDGRIDATTLPPHVTDRLDLHHAVWVLTQQAA